MRELLTRIRALLRRSAPNAAATTVINKARPLRFGQWTLDTASRELIDDQGKPAAIRVSGYALLLAFVKHPFEPMSREVQSLALQREYVAYVRIIDVHLRQIRWILGTQPDGNACI